MPRQPELTDWDIRMTPGYSSPNALATEHIQLADTPVPSQRSEIDGTFEAELWCEFDCVAYVFVGDDRREITQRLNQARAGEQTWDYVRPLSRAELYNIDV